MPINILVIDDEKETVESLMNMLKRKDSENILGEIIVDNSMLKSVSNLEEYNISKYGINFNAVLIDYQLDCEFSGILVSAWMLVQQIKAPRITLTGAEYPGPKEYFDGHILKDDIVDNSQYVISYISSCVENFNYEKWLEDQHQKFVELYSKMLSEDNDGHLNPCEQENLHSIEALLDKFEKIIDAGQEEAIKMKMQIINSSSDFAEKHELFANQMSQKQGELNKLIKTLEKQK